MFRRFRRCTEFKLGLLINFDENSLHIYMTQVLGVRMMRFYFSKM